MRIAVISVLAIVVVNLMAFADSEPGSTNTVTTTCEYYDFRSDKSCPFRFADKVVLSRWRGYNVENVTNAAWYITNWVDEVMVITTNEATVIPVTNYVPFAYNGTVSKRHTVSVSKNDFNAKGEELWGITDLWKKVKKVIKKSGKNELSQ